MRRAHFVERATGELEKLRPMSRGPPSSFGQVEYDGVRRADHLIAQIGADVNLPNEFGEPESAAIDIEAIESE